VRDTDNSKIVYDKFGISLISLLRIGLTPARKDEFYSEFLQIPVYEDMATWNIQFKAGKLIYTDRDTEDKHYNDLIPYTYQVILALMNYKRTIQDFGKCGPNYQVTYNFPYVGDCVGTQKGSTFKTPCKNPSLPVPCADGECKANFVECLRDLRELEITKDKASFEKITQKALLIKEKGIKVVVSDPRSQQKHIL